MSFSPLKKRPSEDLQDPGLTVTDELDDAGQTHVGLPSVCAELLLILESGDTFKPEMSWCHDEPFWNTT